MGESLQEWRENENETRTGGEALYWLLASMDAVGKPSVPLTSGSEKKKRRGRPSSHEKDVANP